jgi:hypothetical protein
MSATTIYSIEPFSTAETGTRRIAEARSRSVRLSFDGVLGRPLAIPGKAGCGFLFGAGVPVESNFLGLAFWATGMTASAHRLGSLPSPVQIHVVPRMSCRLNIRSGAQPRGTRLLIQRGPLPVIVRTLRSTSRQTNRGLLLADRIPPRTAPHHAKGPSASQRDADSRCWVNRSRSRNGSVRLSITNHLQGPTI